MEEKKSLSERIGAVLGAATLLVVLVALLIAAVGLGIFAARATWFVITDWPQASAAVWQVVTNNLPNLGTLAASFAAVWTVFVLVRTNTARAREAVNNDYREFMEWALENVNEHDDLVTRFFAFKVIENFAKEPHKLLAPHNVNVAQKVYDALTSKFAADQGETGQQTLDLNASVSDTEEPAEGGPHEHPTT